MENSQRNIAAHIANSFIKGGMPIGTVSKGYRKVSETKWEKVTDGGEDMKKEPSSIKSTNEETPSLSSFKSKVTNSIKSYLKDNPSASKHELLNMIHGHHEKEFMTGDFANKNHKVKGEVAKSLVEEYGKSQPDYDKDNKRDSAWHEGFIDKDAQTTDHKKAILQQIKQDNAPEKMERGEKAALNAKIGKVKVNSLDDNDKALYKAFKEEQPITTEQESKLNELFNPKVVGNLYWVTNYSLGEKLGLAKHNTKAKDFLDSEYGGIKPTMLKKVIEGFNESIAWDKKKIDSPGTNLDIINKPAYEDSIKYYDNKIKQIKQILNF